MIRLLLNFYLTLAIPLLYAGILWLIKVTPDTFPVKFELLSNPYIRLFYLVCTFLGIILWVISYFYLRKSFGVLPQKKNKKVTSGPYKYLSHPMYVGIFLTFAGLSLATLSYYGFLANLLILTPINIIRSWKESQLIDK